MTNTLDYSKFPEVEKGRVWLRDTEQDVSSDALMTDQARSAAPLAHTSAVLPSKTHQQDPRSKETTFQVPRVSCLITSLR